MNIWLEILRCPLHPNSGFLSLVKIKNKSIDLKKPPDKGLKCKHCGNIYPIIDNIPDMIIKEKYEGSFLESEARQWDLHVPKYEIKRTESPIYMAGIDAAVEALQPQKRDFILDAACGTGITVKKYLTQDVRVVALDISMESLRYIRNTINSVNPIILVRGDVCALPFSSMIFDKVLCANGITQIPEENRREDAVMELSRVAKQRSRVVITVQNLSKYKKLKGWRKEGSTGSYSGNIQYIYRYETDEFQSQLASSLKIEKLVGAGLPLPYYFKLYFLSQRLERFLRRFKASAYWGDIIIGKCNKP